MSIRTEAKSSRRQQMIMHGGILQLELASADALLRMCAVDAHSDLFGHIMNTFSCTRRSVSIWGQWDVVFGMNL